MKCNRFVDELFCFSFSKLSELSLCFQMHQLTFVTRRPCWSENIGFLPRSSFDMYRNEFKKEKDKFRIPQDSMWPPCH